MLDIKFIRENPEKVKEACRNKQVKVDIDALLGLDQKRRELLQAVEEIRAKKNEASNKITKSKLDSEKKGIIFKMKELDKRSERLDKSLKILTKECDDLILQIPNIPFDDVPVGKDETENKVLREVGEKTKFDFQFKNYLELAENLDLIDVKRAAKVSGTRFGYLKRGGAFLEFALLGFALETLTEKGFIPVVPPVMIKPEMAKGMGYPEQFDGEEAYYIQKDNLFLVGTAEQSVGPMHAEEILDEKELPKRYVAFPCTSFRREAGAYGKDTKGIFRVHQFDKIEMFSFSYPEKSKEEHEFFLSLEEKLMQALKIPYRLVQICTGDLGFPAASKYDIEAWIPSENRYRETHSTSSCTDFQARRLNIRYRDKTGKLNFVHTINGTAFAIGRTLIAIIENYQQKDGSILVPEVLQKYLTFKEIHPVK